MAHLQNLMLPRWRARVMERNTFLAISFADESEDYEAVSLRRSSSEPLFPRAEPRRQTAQVMIDVKFESNTFGVNGGCEHEEAASQCGDSIETGSAAETQQDPSGVANSDISTDVETDTAPCENNKVKSLLSEILSGAALDDAKSSAPAVQSSPMAKKSKSGRQWRPCKGARIRFRKLLNRLMDEIDKDPQGREFKDAHFLGNVERSLAESQFREIVRSRLIEVLRQKDHIASEQELLK